MKEVKELEFDKEILKRIEDLVSNQLKGCYDNHLYSENDISDIVKDTLKEKELTNYIEEKDYDYF